MSEQFLIKIINERLKMLNADELKYVLRAAKICRHEVADIKNEWTGEYPYCRMCKNYPRNKKIASKI